MNLLPPDLEKSYEHQRQGRTWIAVWGAVVGLLFVAQLVAHQQSAKATAQLDDLQRLAEPLRAMETKTTSLTAQTRALREQLRLHRSLEEADVPLALLQVVSRCSALQGGQVMLDTYRMDEAVNAARGKGNSGESENTWTLTFSGTAHSAKAISDLVQRLRGEQVFATVELDASQATGDAEQENRSFQIRCQL